MPFRAAREKPQSESSLPDLAGAADEDHLGTQILPDEFL
jgi:hypothetical protein